MNKPLHIFKPGTYTAMGGQTLSFTEAQLTATAQAYDPAKSEAPLVVGHPAHDLPAYGWVSGLQFADGGLQAQPAQVDPAFAEMVNRGAYKKISASFYPPDAPNNPVPGTYYLRHVGFLGAQPPAVKGLRQAAFADDAQLLTFEFGEYERMTVATLFRRVRELIISKFGTADADKALPDFELRQLELDAMQGIADAAAARPGPLFSEVAAAAAPAPTTPEPELKPKEPSVTEEEAAQLREQNAQLMARATAAEAAATAQLQAAARAANTAFAESLATEARLIAAEVPVVVEMLSQVSPAPGATPVSFGEGAAAVPLADAFRAFLKGLPPRVALGEQAGRERAAQGVADSVSYAEGADPERIEQDKKVRAHMALHKTDYATAARAVLG